MTTRARLCAVTLLLLVACRAMEPTERFDTGSATVVISALSPPPGSLVTADTVIAATLKYDIPDYVDKQDLYFLMPQFFSTDRKRTIGVKDSPDTLMKISSQSGTVSLKVPLKELLSRPDVKRPVRLYFFLNQNTDPHKSVVIGAAGPVEYQ